MARRLGWSTRLAICAAIVLLAAGVLVVRSALAGHSRRSSGPEASPPRSSTSASPPAITPTDTAPSVSAAVPTSAPFDISWSLFDGIALPSSVSAGPTRVSDAVHAGFAHNPEGALIADAQIAVRYLATPGTGWRDVLARQIVPGPGVAAYSTERVAAGLGNISHVDTTGVGQFVGFRFVTYTAAVAVVQVVVRFPSSGQYQVATNTVDWLDGDWKLQLLPDGSSASTVQQVNDLAGFVAWSGVSS